MATKKSGACIRSIKFFSSKIPVDLLNLCCLTCIIVVMPGLVLPIATWTCGVSYRDECTGFLVLHLLLLLNPWRIVEILPAGFIVVFLFFFIEAAFYVFFVHHFAVKWIFWFFGEVMFKSNKLSSSYILLNIGWITRWSTNEIEVRVCWFSK